MSMVVTRAIISFHTLVLWPLMISSMLLNTIKSGGSPSSYFMCRYGRSSWAVFISAKAVLRPASLPKAVWTAAARCLGSRVVPWQFEPDTPNCLPGTSVRITAVPIKMFPMARFGIGRKADR